MTTDSDVQFKFKLEQLQDQSVLQALRGLCERVGRDLQSSFVSTERGGKGNKKKAKASVPCDNPLVAPLRSLLARASRVEDGHQRRAIVGYLAGFLREHIWVLDLVYRDGDGSTASMVLDAIFDGQGDEDTIRSLKRLLRLFRRDEVSADVELCRLVVRRSAAALEKVASSGVSVLDCPWAPWALALAALPLIDARYAKQMYVEDDTIVRDVVRGTCDAMIRTPEVFVDSLSGNVVGSTSVETVIALCEVTMQVVLGQSLESSGSQKGTEMRIEDAQKTLAGLLTVRWELEWVARALGVCKEFRSHFSWDALIRNQMLRVLLEDRDQSTDMADEFGLAVGLRCTPPQTLVALELLRASKASRDACDVEYASYVGKFVRAGMQGLYKPKEVMSAERNQEFANLGQRIQVLISRNLHLDRMMSKRSGECVKVDEGNTEDARDEAVDELLSLIGVGGQPSEAANTSNGSRTPRSSRRKVHPERIGDVNVKEEMNNDEEIGENGGKMDMASTSRSMSTSIHHNGRVIMPPTFNLDSEAREQLWKEYLKDKDKLVEMLGDSNYRKWHDESRRPELRRRSGVDKAFDAVFGAGTAINDAESLITDESGALVENSEKKALDLCCTVPWDALLVGALAVATDMVRRLGSDPTDHARVLSAVVDAYEVDHYVQEALDALPEEGRVAMESCAGQFTASAGLGGLICISGTLKKILLHTTRHTRSELLGQYLELMQVAESRCFHDISTRRKLRRPALLASTNLRACMSFPPLMGNSVNSKSAKLIPELCALARDTESIVYTSACCWTVWHSLKSKRVPADWIPDGVDLSTHPLCAAGVQQRCHFISSSLRLVSSMVQEIDETDAAGGEDLDGSPPEDIIAALVSSSSLCATVAVDLRKGLTLYRSRTKNTKSAFQVVCEQTQVHLTVFSVASALCEIYCGLADDWDDFISSTNQGSTASTDIGHESSIPHAGAVVFGCDFTEAMQTYLSVLSEDKGSVLCSAISPAVLDSIFAAISETKTRLHHVLQLIQDMDRKSDVYKLSAQQIKSAPAIVVMDTITHYSAPKEKVNGDTNGVENQAEKKKRKTIKDVENPYLRAALMEEGPDSDDDFLLDDDLSDLEDFIVTNPDVDYVEFLHDHFPHGRIDDED